MKKETHAEPHTVHWGMKIDFLLSFSLIFFTWTRNDVLFLFSFFFSVEYMGTACRRDRAKEIHLCGEETAVELIQTILKHTGDEFIVNRYERLTPLQIAPKSLASNLTSIRPGDFVVGFSRRDIFSLKDLIEEKTGLRCAVAYGRLPPEVRREQAGLFNESHHECPVMVASDAIGMGLNL